MAKGSLGKKDRGGIGDMSLKGHNKSGCFRITQPDLSCFHRDCKARKVWTIYHLSLYGKSSLTSVLRSTRRNRISVSQLLKKQPAAPLSAVCRREFFSLHLHHCWFFFHIIKIEFFLPFYGGAMVLCCLFLILIGWPSFHVSGILFIFFSVFVIVSHAPQR